MDQRQRLREIAVNVEADRAMAAQAAAIRDLAVILAEALERIDRLAVLLDEVTQQRAGTMT
jgi:hypothetical protein